MPTRSDLYGAKIVPSPAPSSPSSPSTNTVWVESSNTRTTTASAAVVPSVAVTARSKPTVVTSSGAVNDGDGPVNAPAPPVTSGPDVCVHTIDSSDVPAARPTAASWTAAPRSTARSTPALATAGTTTVVVVSGTVVDVVDVVE